MSKKIFSRKALTAVIAGCTLLARSQGIPTSVLVLTNPLGSSFGSFGQASSSVGNDRMVIGAPVNNVGGILSGGAYLFDVNGTLLTTFTNPTPGTGDYFGNAVASVGPDRIVIGAWLDDSDGINTGAAYLFSTNGARLLTFAKPAPSPQDFFGVSVAALGTDKVVIGSLYDDVAGVDAGAAYLFRTNGTLLTTFTNPNPTFQDLFGYSVAALGTNRVIIGAYQDNAGAAGAGAAYLFNSDGQLLTVFTNPTPAPADNFGITVTGVGTDRILVGAPNDGAGGSNAGAAYLFATNGTLLTTFTNPTPASGERFGFAVAAMGSGKLLIGTANDGAGATNLGAVYLFNTNGSLITTLRSPQPMPGARFGAAVTPIGSDRILVGAPNENIGGGQFSGAACLFTLGYPALEIAGAGTNFTVTWLTPEPELILQHATNLTSPSVWNDLPGAPAVTGWTNVFPLMVPLTAPHGFYRLRRP